MTTKQIAAFVASVLINRLPADQYDNVLNDFNEVGYGSYNGSVEEVSFAKLMAAAMESECAA